MSPHAQRPALRGTGHPQCRARTRGRQAQQQAQQHSVQIAVRGGQSVHSPCTARRTVVVVCVAPGHHHVGLVAAQVILHRAAVLVAGDVDLRSKAAGAGSRRRQGWAGLATRGLQLLVQANCAQPRQATAHYAAMSAAAHLPSCSKMPTQGYPPGRRRGCWWRLYPTPSPCWSRPQ